MDKMIRVDLELGKYAEDFNKEYELIQSIVEIRKDLGLTQQMVSRIEKLNNSPTLINFIRYINALGLELVRR